MSQKILRGMLILSLIVVMTIGDVVLLGYNIAIAIDQALENQENLTNVKNVEFNAYFNDNKNQVRSKAANLANGDTLFLSVNVKNTGSLNNAKIKIENANFKFKSNSIDNTYVKNVNIENNEIELNSVIYGNNVEIAIPIEFTKQNIFDSDYFERENTIKLIGLYKEDDKEIEVNGEIKTKLLWSDEAEVNLSQDIEKYIDLGENGILLQQKIVTDVVNNALPRENETITIHTPVIGETKAMSIEVLANGEILSQDKVNYDSNTGIVEIQNNTAGIWKNEQNVYKIIYIFEKQEVVAEIQTKLLTTSSTKLYTKEIISKQDEQLLDVALKGNIVSLEKVVTPDMYKGYMYANSNNGINFEEQDNVEITKADLVNSIEIQKINENFIDANEAEFNLIKSTMYTNTVINKNDFLGYFGEDGYITIKDEQENIISTITKDSQEDENGNIVINYDLGISKIEIITTKPLKEGCLKIQHNKVIDGQTEFTKEQLKTFEKLQIKSQIKTNLGEEESLALVELKDTITEAKIEISNTNLSTLQTNDNVQILATLKSDSEKYDLYKNPYMEIVFPEGVKVDVQTITQLNATDELKIVDAKLETIEGKQIVKITFEGEQVTFANSISEGLQIAIVANVDIDKTIPSESTQIVMNYTNENRNSEQFTVNTPINLSSKYGTLIVNKIEGYNSNGDVLENTNDKVKVGNLDKNAESKVANSSMAIVNNYENAIENVCIIGKIPNQGEETINGEVVKSTIASNIVNNIGVNKEDAKIFYSTDSNATKDSATWTEVVEDYTKIKSFKIELEGNAIGAKEVVKINCGIAIPEKLEANQSMYTNLNVSYNYLGQTVNTNSVMSLMTDAETVQEDNSTTVEDVKNVSVQITAKTGEQTITDGMEVSEGQGVQYVVKLTNNGTSDVSNIKVTATNTNAIYYDTIQYVYDGGVGDWLNGETLTKIDENPELTNKEFTVEKLAGGESIELKYQISIKENTNGQELIGNVNISADGIDESELKEPTLKIKQAKIKMQVYNEFTEDIKIYTKEGLPIKVNVKNIFNENLKDIIIQVPVPEELSFSEEYMYLGEDDKCQFVEYKNGMAVFKINELLPEEQKSIQIKFIANSLPSDVMETSTKVYAKSSYEGAQYISNTVEKEIFQLETEISLEQIGSINGNIVNDKDKITYTATIKNEGLVEKDIVIEDSITNNGIMNKAYIENEAGEKEEMDISANTFLSSYTIKPGETIKVVLEVTLDASMLNSNKITNKILVNGLLVAKENSLTYEIAGKKDEDNGGTDSNDKYKIEGIAWNDANKNGVRESYERKLSNINVILINSDNGQILTDENGNKIESKTNEEGYYEFDEVSQGKYLVVFEYDTTKYTITEFKKDKIDESVNSDVIVNTIELNGIKKKVAITEELKVSDANLENIDAGFVEAKTFDFKLDKYINQIIVQDSSGTRTIDYSNTQLAKVELDAKKINNANVIIKYLINVTNEGDVAGYTSELVDYIPNDLKFNSELNKSWYQGTDNNIYTKELADNIINPGETKVVELILVKTMTQNNTGTIINTAEIFKQSNESETEDIDSTPANKKSGEDDMSTAEVITSIRTGGVVEYIIFIFIALATIAGGSYFIKVKVLKDVKEEIPEIDIEKMIKK